MVNIRLCFRFIQIALSGTLSLGSIPNAAAADWIWQEGEAYVDQQGCSRPDGKRAAASYGCLGMGWGHRPGDFARYRFTLDDDIPQAELHLRYARGLAREATIEVTVDADRGGTTSVLRLPQTPGWGQETGHWRFLSLPLGPLNAGEHTLTLTANRPGSNLNLDGFYIAGVDEPPPGLNDAETLLRHALEANTGPLGQIYRRRAATRALSVMPAPDTHRFTTPVSLATILDDTARSIAPELRRDLAAKPSPYLVNPCDVGPPTDFDRDIPWHLLDKEKDPRFTLPHRGKLGVFNTNADIAWVLGMALDDEAIDESPRRRYRDHLINLAAIDVDLGPVTGTVMFMPVTSDSILAVMQWQNSTDSPHRLRIDARCTKPPVALLPEDRYDYGIHVTTGKLAWVGADPQLGLAASCYDDWDRLGERPIGSLLATMRADIPPAGFRTRFDDDSLPIPDATIEGTQEPRESILTWHVTVPAHRSASLRVVLNLHRFGPTDFEPPRQMKLYAVQTPDEALVEAARRTTDALHADWPALVRQSFRWYEHVPIVTLPDKHWPRDFYCCLELPRGNTFSPQDRIAQRWYTFCRVHGHDPYGWWSYGMHGHEHLATFVTNITEPALSQEYLSGHLQVQRDDGYIQYGVNHRLNNIHEWGLATCPFLMAEAWAAYTWSGDRTFLQRAYDAGTRYLTWWRSDARTRPGQSLQHWADYVESVRDDADLLTWMTTNGAQNQEALDLNGYLLNEERTLATMARELGHHAAARQWQADADRRVALMREHLWHAEDGVYYGRDLTTGHWARAYDIATFIPLYSGLATPAQVPRLLELLHDPQAFGTRYPVATLAVQHMPDYQRGQFHWRGSNWVEMSWLAIRGLKDYGCYREAARLANVNADMVFKTLEETGHFREFYNSITGAPTDLTDYIWTCMPAIMIVDVLFGIRPTATGLQILPALPDGWRSAQIENLRVRDATVRVSIQRDPEVERTRARVNGAPPPVTGRRGVMIPWQALDATTTVEIIQPLRIQETIAYRGTSAIRPAGTPEK